MKEKINLNTQSHWEIYLDDTDFFLINGRKLKNTRVKLKEGAVRNTNGNTELLMWKTTQDNSPEFREEKKSWGYEMKRY